MEIEVPARREALKLMCKSDVPKDAIILGRRFVLSIKDESTPNECGKLVPSYKDINTGLNHLRFTTSLSLDNSLREC